MIDVTSAMLLDPPIGEELNFEITKS